MLKMLGHDVRMEHDGPAAIAAVAEVEPDLVFLDIGMPKMNGYEAAERIRSDSCERSVKIVAVTGWGQEEVRRRVARAGFDEHVVKPVTLSALRALLDCPSGL